MKEIERIKPIRESLSGRSNGEFDVVERRKWRDTLPKNQFAGAMMRFRSANL